MKNKLIMAFISLMIDGIEKVYTPCNLFIIALYTLENDNCTLKIDITCYNINMSNG